MKTIITGASGFVGQNLSRYLKQKNIFVEELSLRNKEWSTQLNQKANALIHLAGKAHDVEKTAEEKEYFEINRDLTIELFHEFLKSEIQDFFFFSSVKAVVDHTESIVHEEMIPNPQTPYGKSKLEAELYLLAQNLPLNKRLFIIRPCMIHGPGNKGNLNILFSVLEKGMPWPLTKFVNHRSFLSIDNLSFMMYEMLNNKNLKSGIYNFADDESLSTNELVVIMNKVLGKKTKFLHLPKFIVYAIAKLGDVVNLPLNSERMKKLTENYVVSNQKIKNALGINRLPVSPHQGITDTIKSFKKIKDNLT